MEKPTRDIGAAIENLTNLFAEHARKITETIANIREQLEFDTTKLHEALHAINAKWAPVFAEVRQQQDAKEALRKTQGILPHSTTPFDLYQPENPDQFGPSVTNYYVTHWNAVKAKFLDDLEGYNVSNEAKNAMREALECHQHGLFRSVVLTLLPNVEMEFRRTFGIDVGGNAASLKEFREAMWHVPAAIVFAHVAPLDLMKIVDRHLYEKIKTADDLDRFKLDSIPNRHAAIHGLIEYCSFQNSLNTLILTDYVFFLISQLEDIQPPQNLAHGPVVARMP